MSNPIPASSYTEEYFLKHNSGWLEWSEGKRDAGRFGYLFNLANIKPGGQILDLGCGRGEIGYLCARAGAIVNLLDYSPDALNLAKQTLSGFKNVNYYLNDIKQFPVAQYNHIFCLDVLEHLYDWEITEVVDRVKKCSAFFWGWTSPEKNWALKNRPETMGDKERHINCHTEESIRRLFNGFEIEFFNYSEMHLVFKAWIKPLIFNLNIDDFSPATNFRKAGVWLMRLIKDFPEVKISLFIIPNFKGKSLDENLEWVDFAKSLPKDNFEICLHGFTHQREQRFDEFAELTKEEAVVKIKQAEELLNKVGITYSKVFKAPCWKISEQAREAVKELGYRMVSKSGTEIEGDLVSGQWQPHCIYSTHTGDHDGNTSFMDENMYFRISNMIKTNNHIQFKFLRDL